MGMRVRLGPVSVSSRGRVGLRAGPVSVYGGGGGRRRPSGNNGGGEDLGGIIVFLLGLGLAFVVVVWPLSLWGHAIGLTPSWHQLMNEHKAWMHEHYPLVGLRYLGAALALTAVLVGVVAGVDAALAPRRARTQAERLAVLVEEREVQAARQTAETQQAERRRQEQLRLAEQQRAEQRTRVAEERRTWLAGPPPPFTPPERFTQAWIVSNVPNLHPGQIPLLRSELRARGWNDDKIELRITPHLSR